MKRIKGYRVIGYKLEGDPDNDAEVQNAVGAAGTTKGTSGGEKAPVDNFVAALCLQAQQGSTDFNRIPASD
jgi:hypothetical protein